MNFRLNTFKVLLCAALAVVMPVNARADRYSSNQALVNGQNIVRPPEVPEEFRFVKVEERLFVVKEASGAVVYEIKHDESRPVGEFDYYGYGYILDDMEDDWYYVESGNVRGFMKAEDIVTDDVAKRILDLKGKDELSTARMIVPRNENAAFLFTKTTVQNVVAEKDYAIAKGEVYIHEQRKESAPVVGTLEDGALCYLLADKEDEWVYAESADARGFIPKESLITGEEAEKIVEEKGEENMALASVQILPKDNKSCYYTMTSVKEASKGALTREAMVEFALQFVGNPYVWGGTSLTSGADCSGFVQSIYAYFGYTLPRIAEQQALFGTQIPVEDALPGDLIFYARNGYVYHVVMYIGDGQVVEAANTRRGIITNGIQSSAVWATRIIED